MKSFFSNLPLGRKLTLITMLISGVALLLACTAFAVYEQTVFRRTMARDLAVVTDMFEDNVVAGLQFRDRNAMEETLGTLKANEHIIAAAVYDQQGTVVARYQRSGPEPDFIYPAVRPTSQQFTADRLDTYEDITLGDEVIGVIFISSDLRELNARAWRYIIVVGLLLVACLLVALLLASYLQTIISTPIVSLAKTVAIVATGKDYSVRAAKRGNDEVGRLIDGFNEMLHQIQARDTALEASRHELEDRVEERTKELAKSLSLLNATLESTTDGIAAADLAGNIISYNSKFAAIWNFPAELLTGRNAAGMRAHVVAQLRDTTGFLNLAQDLPREKFDLYELKDGRTLERYIFPQLIEGRCVGSVINWRDITARKRAEEELRLLSSAVEQSRESILITDAQLDRPGPRIVFVNPAFAKMTGYTAAETLGGTPRILQGPHTDRAVLDRLRQNLARGEAFEGIAVNYRKDGTAFNLEWQIAPIRNARGSITHFVAIQHDITERTRAEGELQQVHRQLLDASRQAGMAEVATGVLHNVGNVLNSVNVSATLVADHIRHSKAANLAKVCTLLDQHAADLGTFLTSDPKGRIIPAYLGTLAANIAEERGAVTSELESLRKNIEHIKDIVAMQQNYAKNSGFTETISLPDLVEDALRINAGSLARHAVDLVRDYQVRPVVTLDKHKVMQILINLIRNAKYACDESGRTDKLITVRLTADERCVQIAISDNGVGIPAENLTRIFNHGFTTRKTGHGFGLHSGALAAKELGGALTGRSAGAGHGATFTLELPVTAAAFTAALP